MINSECLDIDIYIDTKYQEILALLKENKRPRIALQKNEVNSLTIKNNHSLRKILCILNYSAPHFFPFANLITKALSDFHQFKEENLIFLLSASQIHVIDGSKQTGEKIPLEFIKNLGNILENSLNWEVRYWVLTLLSQCGLRSRVVIDQIKKIRPNRLSCLFAKLKTNKYLEQSLFLIDQLSKK